MDSQTPICSGRCAKERESAAFVLLKRFGVAIHAGFAKLFIRSTLESFVHYIRLVFVNKTQMLNYFQILVHELTPFYIIALEKILFCILVFKSLASVWWV